MTARLQVTALSRSYGRHTAVDGLTLTLPAGAIVGLIGPNGAGKSTTMRLIAGHQAADSGQLLIDGKDLTNDPESCRRLCALTPQDLALHEHLTPEETMRFHARLRGLDENLLEERIARWIEAAFLTEARHLLVRELSGGMKRKLAMGCALIAPLPLVLLDESFVGLDPESTRSLERQLRAHCREHGTTILLSSHLLDMIQRLADEVVMMRAGRLVHHWTRDELDALIPDPHSDLTDLYLRELGGLEADVPA